MISPSILDSQVGDVITDRSDSSYLRLLSIPDVLLSPSDANFRKSCCDGFSNCSTSAMGRVQFLCALVSARAEEAEGEWKLSLDETLNHQFIHFVESAFENPVVSWDGSSRRL